MPPPFLKSALEGRLDLASAEADNLEDLGRTAEAALLRGESRRWRGDGRGALAGFDRAYSLASGHDPDLAAEAAFRAACTGMELGGRFDLGGLIRVAGTEGGRRFREKTALLEAWGQSERADWMTSPGEARRIAKAALRELDRLSGSADAEVALLALAARSEPLMVMERYDAAVESLELGKERARAEGWPTYGALLMARLARTYLELDRPDDALEQASCAQPAYAALGNPRGEAEALSVAGEVALLRGQDAASYFLRARELAYPSGEAEWLGQLDERLGTAHLARGRVAEARGPLRSARRLLRRSDPVDRVMAEVAWFEYLLAKDSRWLAVRQLRRLVTTLPVKDDPSAYNRLRGAVLSADWLRDVPSVAPMLERPQAYTVDEALLGRMLEAARRAHPKEFGAILVGHPHITDMEYVPETAHSGHEVVFNLYNRFSGEWLKGDGVVHSHPSGAAIPSRADRAMFARFPGINIIIGYPYTRDSWAAYDRAGNPVRVDVVRRSR